MKENYTILAASHISGVPTESIRAWERRYKALTPQRLQNGRRSYSTEDIEKLSLLNKLTHEGHSIGQIASLSTKNLKNLYQKHSPQRHPLAEDLIKHLHDFDMEKISEIIEESKLTLETRSFVLDFAAPILSEVGILVENEKMTIAQEHIISSILRSHFGTLLQISANLKPQKRFIFTTPEGDFHEFGILLCAALCLSRRIGIHYLGPNLPAHELIMATKMLSPKAIILSVARLPKDLQKVDITTYLKEVRTHTSASIPIFVGGDGYRPRSSADKGIQFLPTLAEFDKMLEKFTK